MKRYFLFISLLILLFGFALQYGEVLDTCKSKEAKQKCKEMLGDYTYDAANTTRITFKESTQHKEIEAPLFRGEKYRFVFSTQGLPQPVEINIYDKPSTAKNKTLVFTNTSFPETDSIFIFEPEKPKNMFINYTIPATNDTIKKGCIVFVLGYVSTGVFSGNK